MTSPGNIRRSIRAIPHVILCRICLAIGVVLYVAACGPNDAGQTSAQDARTSEPQATPQALQMGGAKSVTRFFVTSKGLGSGGDLGGLAGADAHCQSLASAEGSGDHTWRAYLSVSARDGQPAVNARDRIGKGPWYNAEGLLIAANIEELHSETAKINKETAVTERLGQVNGVGETPNMHDILPAPGQTEQRSRQARISRAAIGPPAPPGARKWGTTIDGGSAKGSTRGIRRTRRPDVARRI